MESDSTRAGNEEHNAAQRGETRFFGRLSHWTVVELIQMMRSTEKRVLECGSCRAPDHCRGGQCA